MINQYMQVAPFTFQVVYFFPTPRSYLFFDQSIGAPRSLHFITIGWLGVSSWHKINENFARPRCATSWITSSNMRSCWKLRLTTGRESYLKAWRLVGSGCQRPFLEHGLILHGLYMGVVLTTYKSWDDPPRPLSRVSLVIDGLVYPLN